MRDNTINSFVTISEEATVLAGRYRIIHQLGQGGMGSVWLAEDEKLDGRKVAIKMLPSVLVANKRAYRQVKSEALVSLKLSHPNIATLRSFEEENGNPFLVVDYIDGQSLDDYLGEHGAMTEPEVVALLTPVAEALDYAHKERVVHRDVKPANIMIRNDGTPFVLDFGIAREMQETMTRVTGKLSSGTLMYMSPEQLKGAAPAPAQDIYSFAAMIYECLTDHPPFYRGQIEYQIETQRPENLPDGIAIAGLIMSGLDKSPENRPTSCLALLGGQMGLNTSQNISCAGGAQEASHITSDRRVEADKNEAHNLELIKAQIANKKTLADDLCSRADALRADSLGFSSRLARIDSNRNIIRKGVEVADLASAQVSLSTIAEAEEVIRREVEWLEANVKLRDECRQYFTSVLSKHEDELKEFRDELEGVAEYNAGNRHWKEAAALFEAGEFAQAEEKWRLMDADFTHALAKANEIRIDRLLETAKEQSRHYDWDECLSTIANVLSIRPDCAEALTLRRLAEEGRKKEGCSTFPGSRRTVDLGHGVLMEFVYCPPGTFVMGSPVSEPERNADENERLLNLTCGFWIGLTPVTKAQWREIMGGLSQVRVEGGVLGFSDDEHPKTSVSWFDCKRFVKEASMKCGVEFGLPTEAQWEYACRAGTTTPYCFGGVLNGDLANCNGRIPYGTCKQGEYKASTTKVGLYKPNAWGLFDCHGNVSEWCEDWYADYESTTADPIGPDEGGYKVLRGGNWFQRAKDCRSASRGKLEPARRLALNGFRIVVKKW